MKSQIILLLAFIGLLSVSCEKEVPVDLPDSKNKLVMNCIMNEDSVFMVLVSRTKKLYVDDNANTNITNATVSIYENGVFVENLLHDTAGVYISKTFKPKVGNTYKVAISCEGYADAYAEEQLIKQAVVSDFNWKDSSMVRNDGIYSKLSFFIDDPSASSNYYEVEVISSGYYYIVGFDSSGQTYIDSILYVYPLNMLILDDVLKENNQEVDITSGDFQTSNLQFSDKSFNGSKYKIDLYLNSNNHGMNDTLLISVKSVSKSYYEYKRTALQQNNTGPFSEPVRVYSNVTGGVGILGSYSTTKKKLLK